MRRKQFILATLAILLAIAAGIIWWWQSRPGLSAPIELVDIPPGEFVMGERGRYVGETKHLVRITYTFKMSKYEVTQKQWREVMGRPIQQQRDIAQRDKGELSSFWERVKELIKEIKDSPFYTCRNIYYYQRR